MEQRRETGVYMLEKILADVIWGKNMKKQREKGENVKEKGRKGKKMRKGEVKG